MTIPVAFAGWVVEDPDRPVLHDAELGWVTRGQLDVASAAAAGRLAAAGLGPGERLLCSGSPSTSLVVAHLAALRMGAVVLPVNTAYRQAEVCHVVHDARPAVALVERPEMARWITAASPGTVTAALDLALPDGPVPALDGAAAEDPAMLGYTSGTTGRPKGAVLSHGNLFAGADAVRRAWRWTPDDRLVLALPLFHMHGLGVGVHGTLVSGAAAVILPRFDPDAVFDAIEAHDATLLFGVPTMYARLVGADRAETLGRLRLCVSGSAPLDPELHRVVAERTGQVVLERYGMTETVMLASNPYDGERRPGTVGLPLPGVELRLDPGGEILVRGPNVFSGYWGRQEPVRDAEGWFATGDVGSFDDDGYLSIIGRTKELIITGGFNVYPREVEDVLLAHPSVAEVAVVGLPSPEWGETVAAFVVLVPGTAVTATELIAHARERLAHFKCPRQVTFVATLPRNAMGKILRDDVAAAAKAGTAPT